MTSITLGRVKGRTVSLTDEAAAALDWISKARSTTVSGVVEAAGMALAEGGRLGEAGRPGTPWRVARIRHPMRRRTRRLEGMTNWPAAERTS